MLCYHASVSDVPWLVSKRWNRPREPLLDAFTNPRAWGSGKRWFTSIPTSSYGVGPAVTNAVPATADRPEASDEDGKSDGDNQGHPRSRPRSGVRGLPTSCFRQYPLAISFQPRLPTSPKRSTLMCGPSRPPTSTSASYLSNHRQPDDELCISSRSPAEGRVHHKPDGPCPLLTQ